MNRKAQKDILILMGTYCVKEEGESLEDWAWDEWVAI